MADEWPSRKRSATLQGWCGETSSTHQLIKCQWVRLEGEREREWERVRVELGCKGGGRQVEGELGLVWNVMCCIRLDSLKAESQACRYLRSCKRWTGGVYSMLFSLLPFQDVRISNVNQRLWQRQGRPTNFKMEATVWKKKIKIKRIPKMDSLIYLSIHSEMGHS